jgi:biopolymer transport protein TolR
MAMMGSNRGGYRGRRHASPNAMSDINVTPLVDVMLVLLVIFMVTAPLLSVSIPVDLPKTEGKNIASDKQPLVVTVTGTGDLYIQETKVEFEELGTRMQAMKGADPEMRIFVRGDKNINYGRVMEVMGALSSAGFKHVALVADMPEPDKK